MPRSLVLSVGLLIAALARSGTAAVLYTETFETRAAGATVPGWTEVTADRAPLPFLVIEESAANRAFGIWSAGRERLVTRPDRSDTPAAVFLEWLALPDRDLRISGRTRLEYGTRAAVSLARSAAAERVIRLELTADGARMVSANDSDEGPLAAPRGAWIHFTIQLHADRAEASLSWAGDPVALVLATAIPSRDPTETRLGLSIDGRRALFDDLMIEETGDGSPTGDTGPPKITITESGDPFDDGSLWGRVVHPLIAIEDESETTATIRLDGEPFASGATVSADGPHVLDVEARDAAGNRAAASVRFAIDRTAPIVTFAAPAEGACTSAAVVELAGFASDPHLDRVVVSAPSGEVEVTPGENGAWALPVGPEEGRLAFAVTATDRLGHRSVAVRSLFVDRTPPRLEIATGGTLTGEGAFTRENVTLFVRSTDADSALALVTTLDGAPFVSGETVSSEGAHTLSAIAVDCAGNRAEETFSFTIDRTAPEFTSFVPPIDSRLPEVPEALSGRVSPDAVSVLMPSTARSVVPVDGAFAFPSLAVTEGTNRFLLRAIDRAGNVGEVEYRVVVESRLPSIEILDSGVPLRSGAIFRREVRPEIVAAEGASVSATLNGRPFESGTAVSADASHELIATATDDHGRTTRAEVLFRIDRIPPAIAIVTPTAGIVDGERVDVAGTADDAVSVTVNGVTATLSSGAFSATVALEDGETLLVAVGRDAAGNSGRAEVLVSRESLASGIVLTQPSDGTITNRRAVRVAGRVLSPSLVQSVTVGPHAVTIDPAGNFVLESFPLDEGTNAIVASAISKTGLSRSVTVNVAADRTAPVLRILAGGEPLHDQSRFAEPVALSIEASDDRQLIETETRINGVATAMPALVTAAGGHTIVALGTDAAGNQTRVERTLFIGGSDRGGCRLEAFVPASGAVVGATVTGLTGRTGGAAGVKVEGVPAIVSDGSFCATVELPAEGANEITIVCTDAEGNAVGAPAVLTLVRATRLPSVTIEAPAEGAATAEEFVTVTGSAGPGVVEVTVNGRSATIAPGDPNTARAFHLDEVRLVPGLNVLLAKGRTASMKQAAASRRVLYSKDAPSLTVTAPLSGTIIGNSSVSISGTWRNLDPSSLVVVGSAARSEVRALGDSEGSFLFRDVALQSGENALTITATDDLGRLATAKVDLTRVDTAPFIVIAEPGDHAWFGASATSTFTVTGTAIAAPGATIDVAGAPATIVGSEALSPSRTSYAFSAAPQFATLGATPIVARVTEPSGASATHAIRVARLVEPPRVIQIYPESLAASVDPGAAVVVIFSNPMDRATLGAAFRLETSAGSPLAGTMRFDRDALTFAPSVPLAAGEYRIRIGAGARDAGGESLATDFVSTFRAVGEAPSAGPTIDPLPSRICESTFAISGTAPASARVRVELGTLTLDTTADATGRFTVTAPLTGPAGYHLVRARTLGADGTLSPATFACALAGCAGLEVVSTSYDRAVNNLTITFSAEVDPATVTVNETGSIRLRLHDGTQSGGSTSAIGNTILVTPSLDLTQRSFTLEITSGVRASDEAALRAPYTQHFPFSGEEPPAGDGSGFISGEVFDASTGRPLAGAMVSVLVPIQLAASLPGAAGPPFPVGDAVEATTELREEGSGVRGNRLVTEASLAVLTDPRGRYAMRLPEGAHAIHVTAPGYTEVWRQIVVPAGQGIMPVDMRLTPRSEAVEINGAATLMDGGDTAVASAAKLEVPAGGADSGTALTFTSVGAQSLAGLLPLGWSPIASVEIARTGVGDQGAGALLTGTLSFQIDGAAVAAAAQTLSLVRHDSERDEWRVIAPAVTIDGDVVSSPITSAGSYALIFPDPGLLPAPPLSGSALVGIDDPCLTSPCTLTATSFTLDPPIVLPTGASVATLTIDGTPPFPSGTAVQAWIDETLRLSDGSVLLDPPFAADLILYRDLRGDSARAVFAIAPSPRAAEVILEVGYDRLQVLPYPGRLARGTLVGSEGGRIPGEGSVVVDIPVGATTEPIHASSRSLTTADLATLGSIAGFRILGGFALSLERVSDAPLPDVDGDGIPDAAPVELTASARVTFHADPAVVPNGAEVIVAEVLNDTPHGRIVRLAARMIEIALDGSEAKLFTTRSIDRAVLPLDGVVRERSYLFLAAEAPIAFATGAVRRGTAGPYLSDALITAPPLGVQDLTRTTGLFSIVVPAAPATPFTLLGRHVLTGEGAPYEAAAAPDANTVVAIGDFLLVPQPPQIVSTTPASNATSVSLDTTVRVQFDRVLDPSSIATDTIIVTESNAGARVEGTTTLDGASAIVWAQGESFDPGSRYDVTISSTVRSTTDASLGAPYSFSFSTVEALTSTEIDPDRISITIPQSGVSIIRGTAGAIPSGWQAVAVRRGRDFAVRYQSAAAGDGSFAFLAGDCSTTGAGGDVSRHSTSEATSAAPLPVGDLVENKAGVRGEGSGVRGNSAAARYAQDAGAEPATVICGDAIEISDLIDLQILNTNGTLTAILPLTPFISEDRRTFIAPPNETSTVTTPDAITITVPAGAFDHPTLVTATTKPKESLAEVPDLEAELNWSSSIQVDLDCAISGIPQTTPCIAKERIDVQIPAPDADPSKIHILALLGHSIRGPRLMAVDTLRVADGKFTTALASSDLAATISPMFAKGGGGRGQGAGEISPSSADSASTTSPASRLLPPASFSSSATTAPIATTAIAPQSTLTATEVKNHLLGVDRSGIFSVVDVNLPAGSGFGWSVMDGLQSGYDLFWDTLDSFYAAHFYVTEAKGKIAIPILTGVPFKVTGVDSATGLDAFEKIYDPIPLGDPGAGFTVPSPVANVHGPHPVFASPFRIELLDLAAEGEDLSAIRNFIVRLEGGLAKVTDSLDPLAAEVPVTLLNATKGTVDATRTDGLVVSAALGDRIVLIIGSREVDPDTSLSVVFSEPIALGDAIMDDEVDAFLRAKIAVHKIVGTLPPEEVTALFRFGADSGARRISIESGSGLHRGASYRILLSKDLADTSGLKIGEVMVGGETKGGLAADLVLELTTRPPGGTLGAFEITEGSIRDLARSGNTMFVAAMDGGLRSYDIANAAALAPRGFVSGAIDDYWAVAVDDHDRVFATGLGNTFGVLRTFRREQFHSGTVVTQPIGSGMVSWVPGYSSSLNLASATVLSDRAEAIPRKLQIVAQDVHLEYSRGELKEAPDVAVTKIANRSGGFEELSVSVPLDPALQYLVQRVTIENRDAALRWSADARPGAPAVIAGVLARESDRLILTRNQRTYGVVSLFGYGVGMFDLNAMESNDAGSKPADYQSMREHVLMTRARLEESCKHPKKETGAIPDLTFTPEAAILVHPTQPFLRVYALDARRGILDLKVTPAATAASPGTSLDFPFCGRGPMGMLFHSKNAAPPDDPRLHAMRAAFEALASRPPFGRFNVIAAHHWRVEAQDNPPLVPDGNVGKRGTIANHPAERDYLLVAGYEYGLLIAEAPASGYLGAQHLADVVWIPAGAAAVRTIAGSTLATVVDGEGHLLLVDLARIDERWDAGGVPIPVAALFPTLQASLSANGAYGTGLADPRILWRSDHPVASGTLAPLVDAATGVVLTGRLLEKELHSLAAVDPRVRALIDLLGDGRTRETSGIVPLGVRP